MDINPNSPFEFHFPADEPWWDEYDTSDYTSDYNSDFSCDSLFSSESEFDLDEDLDISFNSIFYHISHTLAPDSEMIPKEDDNFVAKLISTISNASPNNVYKRRKLSLKRKRQRKKRKKLRAAEIEPELRMLWRNVDIVGVLPAKDPTLTPPSPSLPTVNLASINKQMLRRLPDVIQTAVHSCSNDPTFYERNLPIGVHDDFTSAFWRENPFGKLPAIWTDLGPIPPPTDSCYGYVWTSDGWRVKAERPPGHVPEPGGGQRRGGVGGGHVGGAERRGGWKNKYLCER